VVLLEKVDLPDYNPPPLSVAEDLSGIIRSPFNNTLGFIRWNSHHPERLPWLQKYAPFFHTLHISMPQYTHAEGRDKEFHNTTVDNWENQMLAYVQVARTLQHILDQPKNSSDAQLTGMFYFHL
jgi:hypothetical protein